MRELKTNTATRITVGPFLDVTDAKTPEVALTATNEKITFVVDDAGVPTLVLDANATGSGGNNDLVHITGDDAGYYDLELTAANVNYLGRAVLAITYVTDHLPVFHEFEIVSAAYFDWKYGSTAPAVASVTGAVGSVTGNVGGNVTGSVGSVVGAVGSVTGAVGSVTGAVGSVTGAVGSIATGGISEASFATTAGSFAPLGIVDQGTAQSATGTTIVLRSAAAFANDELIGATVYIVSATAGAGQSRVITDYVLSTDTATVDTWTTTPSGTIVYKIFATPPASATSVPAVNVTQWLGSACATPSVSGVPEVDLTHVAGATTDVSALATNVAAILVDTGTTLDGRIPAALVSGRMDASVGAMAANVMTAAAAAADLTTELQSGLATAANLATVAGYLDTEIAAILADTNELQTDWANGGRLDLLLDGAASAGDPWTTALPGAYGAGTAGKIVGDNLNATVSSRASQTSVDAVDDLLDTEIAAIKTVVDAILVDTDVIGLAGAGLTALATQASVNTIDDLLDTEVAAIKTVVDAIQVKTDSLTFTVAGVVDANIQRVNDVAITGDGSGTPFNVV